MLLPWRRCCRQARPWNWAPRGVSADCCQRAFLKHVIALSKKSKSFENVKKAIKCRFLILNIINDVFR